MLQENNKTNVIIVITDDQGYGDMSCHGNPWLKTPNIDALYAQSTRLTDFHVSPTCAPTRAALLTGHYTNRTGVWHTIGGRSLLRESETTMAEVFAANGYTTGIFGKWHLGDNYPFRPQDRGFQEVLVHGGGGVGQGPDYWNNNYFDDTYFHNGKPEKFAGYCTDVWFENAINFIDAKQQQDSPFFCYISTNAPHDPYNVSNQYIGPYRKNEAIAYPEFYGMISNLDDNLGKLLNYLKRNHMERNTLLVFMTDNGTSGGIMLNEKGEMVKGYNAGMRGKKGSMYEGGHRVPCFIRWPEGNIPAGHDIDDVTAHIDLLPTFVDLLNLKMPKEVTFDGTSLKKVLLNENEHLPLRAVITDSQRLEQPEEWRRSSVMYGPWRLINGKELYNISNDPGQQHDLANQEKKMVKQLRKDYESWWKDISPVFKESPAIVLCPPQEPVTLLHTHDMHMDEGYNRVAWNQKLIRMGMKSNGWYTIRVQDKGTFKFTLLRWPPEAEARMLDSLPSYSSLPGTTVEKMIEGKALKITRAGIKLDEKEQLWPSSSNAREKVVFETPLEAGEHKLRAWFVNEQGERFASYYVKVERK